MNRRPGPLALLVLLGWTAFAVRAEMLRVPPPSGNEWIGTAFAVLVCAAISVAALHVAGSLLRAVGQIALPLGIAGGVVVGTAHGSEHGSVAGSIVGVVAAIGLAAALRGGGGLGWLVGASLWRSPADAGESALPTAERSRAASVPRPQPAVPPRFNPRTGEWE